MKIHRSAVSNFIHCENAVLLGVDDVRGSTGEDQNRLGKETTLRFVGLCGGWLYGIQAVHQAGSLAASAKAGFLKQQPAGRQEDAIDKG